MTYPLIQSVGIVVFDKDNVLLVRHGKDSKHFKGVVGLPAGKIETGESAIAAAVRELQEETGLVCTVQDLVQVPTVYQATITQKDGTKIFDFHVFYCRKYSGALRATDETEPFWHPLVTLHTLKLLPNVSDAVKEALSFKK